jgi:hypothetical protein
MNVNAVIADFCFHLCETGITFRQGYWEIDIRAWDFTDDLFKIEQINLPDQTLYKLTVETKKLYPFFNLGNGKIGYRVKHRGVKIVKVTPICSTLDTLTAFEILFKIKGE